MKHNLMTVAVGLGLAFGMTENALTDTFGSDANLFSIDFVHVGNAGNANDAGAGGGSYSSPYGGVVYDYRISTSEISQNDIATATAAGMTNVTAGIWSGDQPAANITWYEAAAFVNWLNTSQGYQAAYDLTFSDSWSMTLWEASEQASTGVDSGTNAYRHKDAYYFLPSEDEWYKAAYHQNDGVTANYWDYATASNTAPTPASSGTASGTAVYNGQTAPADVDQAGGLSPYGTIGQNGNVLEWTESASNGINDVSSENRVTRGGNRNSSALLLSPLGRIGESPFDELDIVGFRVASVPEPSTTLLVLSGLGAMLFKRRRSSFL